MTVSPKLVPYTLAVTLFAITAFELELKKRVTHGDISPFLKRKGISIIHSLFFFHHILTCVTKTRSSTSNPDSMFTYESPWV